MQCLPFYRALAGKRLPLRIRRRIDLDRLQPLKTTRIDRKLKERIADSAFLAPLTGEDGYYILHFEHWSKSKKSAIEIVLDYQIQLLQEARRQYPGKKIFIHPLVIHNGRTRFRHDTDMFGRGTAAERRTAHQSLGSFDLVDLSQLSDKELGGRNLLLRAGETLLKHGYDKRLSPTVEQLMPALRKLWQRIETQEAVHQLLTYAVLAAHEDEKRHIMELVREPLNFEEKGKAMRVAGALFRDGRQLGLQEGLEKGKQEGKKEGLLEAARKMLLAGVDVDVVSRAMGLPRQKLMTLTGQ